jgi:hypothetical protein
MSRCGSLLGVSRGAAGALLGRRTMRVASATGLKAFSGPSSYLTTRMITERSFLSEELAQAGVKLDPAPVEPILEVTPEMVDQPNERVRKLVDEVLDLNLMEIGMFFKSMQVRLPAPVPAPPSPCFTLDRNALVCQMKISSTEEEEEVVLLLLKMLRLSWKPLRSPQR